MQSDELILSGEAVDWAAIQSHRDLRRLTIWGGPLKNEDLAPLRKLTSLTSLTLGELAIDDGVFAHLQPLRELAALNLAYTGVQGDFTPLLGLPLREIRLEGCRHVGDASARSLAHLPTLRHLELHMTSLTDAGLAALAALPLEVLWLGPRVTDRGMSTVAQFTNLRHLDICTHLLTDEGVRAIAGLRALEVLWLSRSRITDASVEILAQFSRLRELCVTFTELTIRGIEELRRALPACRMVEE